jgi:methyl-accepting chemotaxis protein
LVGNTDIEDSLSRLDKLTQEEARMASAELLKITHSVDGKVQDVRSDVQDVGNKVQSVEGKVQDVRGDVHDVGDKVQSVEGRIEDVRGDVQNVDHRVQTIGKTISSSVQGVDDKLEHVNRSLSL